MTATASPPAKPTAPAVDFDAIPAALREEPRWLLWRYEWSATKGGWDKPPLDAAMHLWAFLNGIRDFAPLNC
jgi:hypothetical protein